MSGLPVAFALTGAKADERGPLLGILDAHPALVAADPGQTLIGDKNYFGKGFEAELAEVGIELIRPTRKGGNPVRTTLLQAAAPRSSSRSTAPSKPNSTSNATADEPSPASPPVSCNASSRLPQRSGTTTAPASRSFDH